MRQNHHKGACPHCGGSDGPVGHDFPVPLFPYDVIMPAGAIV